MLMQIPTKFKQDDVVRVKETIFGNNGWTIVNQGDKVRIIGLVPYVYDHRYQTGYVVVDIKATNLPDNPIVLAASEIELDK